MVVLDYRSNILYIKNKRNKNTKKQSFDLIIQSKTRLLKGGGIVYILAFFSKQGYTNLLRNIM